METLSRGHFVAIVLVTAFITTALVTVAAAVAYETGKNAGAERELVFKCHARGQHAVRAIYSFGDDHIICVNGGSAGGSGER